MSDVIERLEEIERAWREGAAEQHQFARDEIDAGDPTGHADEFTTVGVRWKSEADAIRDAIDELRDLRDWQKRTIERVSELKGEIDLRVRETPEG